MIPGSARFSIDIRHEHDPVRMAAVHEIIDQARKIADQRRVEFIVSHQEHHAAVADRSLDDWLAGGRACGYRAYSTTASISGAGHDAAVMAAIAPMAMLFLRSPGGVSHHPDERVLPQDVAVGLEVLIHCLDLLANRNGTVEHFPSVVGTVGVA